MRDINKGGEAHRQGHRDIVMEEKFGGGGGGGGGGVWERSKGRFSLPSSVALACIMSVNNT